MIVKTPGCASADFWTDPQERAPCRRQLRRRLEIREAFSPTRLSAEHLRAAYEVVSPMIERAVMRENAHRERERKPGEEIVLRGRRGAR